MSALEEQLNRRLGLEAHYADHTGRERTVPPETLHALWDVLGVPGPNGDANGRLEALEHQAADAILDPVIVSRADRRLVVEIGVPNGVDALEWEIIEENGAHHRGQASVSRLPTARGAKRRKLALDAKPELGYHRLIVRPHGRAHADASATLILTPRRAYLPPALEGRRGEWGLAVQLYGLRSDRNWGIGDFTDLRELVERAAATDAAAIGLNPLHALFPDEPGRASPYSPSSRLFLNTLYIDPEAIDDFGESAAARTLAGRADFREAMRDLRRKPLVDYAGVATQKLRVLDMLYASFCAQHLTHADDPRTQSFRRFQQRGGTALRRFATFNALREVRGATGESQRYWRNWPADLRDPASKAVEEFARNHHARVEFYEYLQWQADHQLGRAAARTRDLGMDVGLYQDLAVGFDPDGADAWSTQEILVDGWSIGAPPDDYNKNGQNWGLLPPNPRRLRELAYQPIVEMLRANMRHAGALRIDHVLGLKRLFWVPNGARPSAGAYVHYPLDDLLGLVALESVRNSCLVIGEDLGTVPAGFREQINERGILSYEVLWFAREKDGRFRAPRRWAKDALATISTHDLPTLAGYWTGHDIGLRDELKLYPDKSLVKAAREERKTARHQLADALRAAGVPAGGSQVPVEQAHRFLARTPSRLVMAQIEDLIGAIEPVNVPGTVDEHPNWRRKLPRTLRDIFDDATVRKRLEVLRDERPRRRRRQPADIGLPRATYRLQLHKGFTFADAEAILPYLQELGISHLYLSPILAAQPGSTHGYDVTSFEEINPELGGEEGFLRLSAAMRRLGMRTIVDFVPNHMGVAGLTNKWWADVLEWARESPHADTFDIDWEAEGSPELRDRVLLPVLGDTLEQLLKRGEIGLAFDAASGGFHIAYFENRFPVRPADYAGIMTRAGSSQAALAELARAFSSLFEGRRRSPGQRRRRADKLKAELARLATKKNIAAALEQAAEAVAQDSSELRHLIARQVCLLAPWRDAASRINYRRFFDINQLTGLCMERPKVFAATHSKIGKLIADGHVHGLRLDHVDGLSDPAQYCRRLRQFVKQRLRGKKAPPFYIIVEKILAEDEPLRADWGVDGTTGYEFTNLVNTVAVEPNGERPLTRSYSDFIGREIDFDELLFETKREIIKNLFGGELNALAARLGTIAARTRASDAYPADVLRPLLRDVAAAFTVYRTYVSPRGVTAEDRRIIANAVAEARRRNPKVEPAVFTLLRRALTGEPVGRTGRSERTEIIRFAMRFQQFTAPVTAKSLEDTAFYRYCPLLSLNEVGGDPRVFGLPSAIFHRRIAERRLLWPNSLLATATHDTKRGEDARVRIDALSEIPDLWSHHVARWTTNNRDGDARGKRVPCPNDEYLIYQTLVGAWPQELAAGPAADAEQLRDFGERVKTYVVKAIREAKEYTSWIDPNAAYEDGCRRFIDRLVDPEGAFIRDFATFQALTARLGALNSLSQTVLKLTLPGVPDTYQGCELWDLSLVDPDNRRPVDFRRRSEMLHALPDRHDPRAHLQDLRARWRNGQIKLHVIAAILAARRRRPWLFAEGSYDKLLLNGPAAKHVVAFARRQRDDAVVVAVGRLFASLAPRADELCPAVEAWNDTVIAASRRLPDSFTNVLSDAKVKRSPGGFRAEELFAELPVAVLVADT
jgi:(1->4)-alpha-D-glucan 1-alpha-D-glucosylmutase